MATIQQSTVKGIRIREAIVGSGASVLMIHGWGADISLLQPLAAALGETIISCSCLNCPASEVAPNQQPPFRYSIMPTFAKLIWTLAVWSECITLGIPWAAELG